MGLLSCGQQCKKTCRLTLGCIASLVSMIIAIVAFAAWKEKGADITELFENWESVPLVNISVVPLTQECTSLGTGFYQLRYTENDFPGAVSFCDCDGASTVSSAGLELAGQCSAVNISNGCVNKAAEPVREASWYGVRVCLRRYDGITGNGESRDHPLNGLNRPRLFPSKACPSDFYACPYTGASALSWGERICVPNGSPCPITDFVRLSNSAATTQATQSGWSCLPANSWGSGNTLCFSRLGTYPPLLWLENSRNGRCFPGKSSSQEQGLYDWRASAGTRCDKVDSRWSSRGDSVTEGVSYQTYTPSLAAEWQDRSASGHALATRFDVLTISTRNEVTWKSNCDYTRNELRRLRGGIVTLLATQTALVVFNVILAVFIGMGYSCWEIKQRDDEDSWLDDTPRQKCIRRFKVITVIVCNIGRVICLIVALLISLGLRGVFGALQDNPCTDEADTQATIDFFAEETVKQANYNIILMALALAEVAYEGYRIWLSWNPDVERRKKLEKEQKEAAKRAAFMGGRIQIEPQEAAAPVMMQPQISPAPVPPPVHIPAPVTAPRSPVATMAQRAAPATNAGSSYPPDAPVAPAWAAPAAPMAYSAPAAPLAAPAMQPMYEAPPGYMQQQPPAPSVQPVPGPAYYDPSVYSQAAPAQAVPFRQQAATSSDTTVIVPSTGLGAYLEPVVVDGQHMIRAVGIAPGTPAATFLSPGNVFNVVDERGVCLNYDQSVAYLKAHYGTPVRFRVRR